jgi:hypothetical protein
MGIDIDDVGAGRRLRRQTQPEKSSEFSNDLHSNRNDNNAKGDKEESRKTSLFSSVENLLFFDKHIHVD